MKINSDPSMVRQECRAAGLNGENQQFPVIIDEIQKIPALLDEIHWMIENMGLSFILCGSSARKLRKSHANMLGGRAIRYELYPLLYKEIPEFDLVRALNHGLLPSHYLDEQPKRLHESYVADYLREEILSEALTRNLQVFAKFLEAASFSNGEVLNYQNVARDCGVSGPTVTGYFQILEDTLIGHTLPSFRKRAKRRQVQAPKFYFFDLGIENYLARRGRIEPGSELFGRAFEHFIFLQLKALLRYDGSHRPLSYWRTTSGFEVDFIVGDAEIAVEVKAAREVNTNHLKGLRAFRDEQKSGRTVLVSLVETPRKTDDGIEILPWRHFLDSL
ncbi:MAG: DUF4143 domain-containing protein [Fibrobacterota bacterium]